MGAYRVLGNIMTSLFNTVQSALVDYVLNYYVSLHVQFAWEGSFGYSLRRSQARAIYEYYDV